MRKKYNKHLDFIIWEEKNVSDPDLITRIYPVFLFMDKGKKAPFLTDRCYTLEELNEELDKFREDIENIRKEAKKKFEVFKKKKGEKNGIYKNIGS